MLVCHLLVAKLSRTKMEDRGPLTNIINWLFTGASIIIVSLRLVSRLKLSNLAGWDDLYISIALVSQLPHADDAQINEEQYQRRRLTCDA